MSFLAPSLLSILLAAQVAPAAPSEPLGGVQGKRAEIRQKILERFDQNQDGRLDATERQAARAAVKERLRKRRSDGSGPGRRGFGRGLGRPEAMRGRRGFGGSESGSRFGRGRLGPQRFGRGGQRGSGAMGRRFGGGGQRGSGRAMGRGAWVRRLDADGNGQIDAAELEALRAKLQERLDRRG